MSAPEQFLIEKRGLYYRSNAAGYTGRKADAGRYTFEEAASRAGPNGPDGSQDGMGIWRESEAPEHSTLCPWDVKMKDAAFKDGYEQARADLCDLMQDDRVRALEAENARLRDARDDAIDTLNAWFDRRKLSHDAIDEAVLNAARGYLRMSRSGGMEQSDSYMVEGVIEDMAHLSVFADLFARAALRENCTIWGWSDD